ncbi:MAG TPA: hypothetical protein VHU89_17450 [Acidobacteriaceae bacterium]|jgi:hypothetical protein|nr:hypothetical protein [Acidobacteriaceae bacterium]
MRTTRPLLCTSEPFHVSARFRLTMEIAIRDLEAGAARDERLLSQLVDPEHRRRQQLLVRSQLERAFQLHELLARTCIRTDRAA